MNTQEDTFTLKLKCEIEEKQKSILEDLNYFLSQDWFVRRVVQNIYNLEQKLIKTKKDKQIRLILSDFLAVILLYKKELDKRIQSEINFKEILQEKEYFEKRIDEIVKDLQQNWQTLKERMKKLENENYFLKQENQALKQEKNNLEQEKNNLEQEKNNLEQEIWNLIEAIAKIDWERRKLENRLSKIRKHISQVVNEKIKKEYEEYLKELEKQIRKWLDKEFKVKKAFLERKLNEKLWKIRLELSNLKIENWSLKKDLEEKERIIWELISKLSQRTIEKADLLLRRVKEIMNDDSEKAQKIELQKENERLKLELEELKANNLSLQDENSQLKEENSRLSDINSRLTIPFRKIYEENL